MASDIGTGASITFASGYLSEIVDIRHSGIERGAIQFSHMGTTVAHIFKPTDLYDPGTLEVDILLDPEKAPPLTATAETVTLTYPTTALKYTASAFLIGYEHNIPLEDRMTATARLKFTGAVTFDITP